MRRRHLNLFMIMAILLLSLPLQLKANDVAFGMGTGYIKAEGIEGTFLLAANFRFNLTPNLILEPEFQYWRGEKKETGYYFKIQEPVRFPQLGQWTSFQYEREFQDFFLGWNALWFVPGRSINIYFGTGLGAHFIRTSNKNSHWVPRADRAEFQIMPQQKREYDKTKFGAGVMGGIDFQILQNASLFITVRYDFVENIRQFKVYSGLRVSLPQEKS